MSDTSHHVPAELWRQLALEKIEEVVKLKIEVAELKRTLKAEFNYDNERLDMEIAAQVAAKEAHTVTRKQAQEAAFWFAKWIEGDERDLMRGLEELGLTLPPEEGE